MFLARTTRTCCLIVYSDNRQPCPPTAIAEWDTLTCISVRVTLVPTTSARRCETAASETMSEFVQLTDD